MVRIEDLVRWVKEGEGRRSISIKIGEADNQDSFKMFFMIIT